MSGCFQLGLGHSFPFDADRRSELRPSYGRALFGHISAVNSCSLPAEAAAS